MQTLKQHIKSSNFKSEYSYVNLCCYIFWLAITEISFDRPGRRHKDFELRFPG